MGEGHLLFPVGNVNLKNGAVEFRIVWGKGLKRGIGFFSLKTFCKRGEGGFLKKVRGRGSGGPKAQPKIFGFFWGYVDS